MKELEMQVKRTEKRLKAIDAVFGTIIGSLMVVAVVVLPILARG